MTPRQIGLLHSAHGEFRLVTPPNKRPLDEHDLQAALGSERVVESWIDPSTGMSAGFTQHGMQIFRELAGDLRSESIHGDKLAAKADLAKLLAGIAAKLWRRRNEGALSDDDLSAFSVEINSWFEAQRQSRTHYVPCALSAWSIPSFDVGPVSFYHISALDPARLGIAAAGADGKFSVFDQLLIKPFCEFAATRHASAVAEVTVSGREKERSALTAEIAVDIALAILQLVMPPKFFDRAARASARSAPVYQVRLSRDETGYTPTIKNDEPGRLLVPGAFEVALISHANVIASCGRRLCSYLEGGGTLPGLDEAWCNAAWWFHQALAEPFETVAVAKLETAIEVLLRAEKSSGSKQRILTGMKALLGIDADKELGAITADQFAASIVTARSRVLHGTWPTLHTEPPGAKNTPVNVDDAQSLTRLLLLNYSVALDDYASAGKTDDKVEELLTWRIQTNGPTKGG